MFKIIYFVENEAFTLGTQIAGQFWSSFVRQRILLFSTLYSNACRQGNQPLHGGHHLHWTDPHHQDLNMEVITCYCTSAHHKDLHMEVITYYWTDPHHQDLHMEVITWTSYCKKKSNWIDDKQKNTILFKLT